jgi:naphtho-gamma-pyrone polyketide synthase
MMEVFVFGDQSTRFAPPLKDLLLKGNSPYLTHFVEQVHVLLRKEISSLPATQRKLFPNFADIQELISKSDWNSGGPALTSALACFYHLCSFIHFYDGQGRTFPPENSRIIGLCVGSLAATAVSCSRSLSELVTAGVDAVRVALYVGLRVWRTTSLFDIPGTPSSTWSIIVPEMVLPRSSAQNQLDSFSNELGLARSSVPYISSVAHHNMTISGPPSVLESFIHRISPSPKDSLPVPIYAPYHASHLYSQDDVDEVLSLAAPAFASDSMIPLISGCSGEEFQPLDYAKLLHCCVTDMLIHPLDLTKVSQAVGRLLTDSSTNAHAILRPISSSVSSSIISALEPTLSERCAVDNSISSSATSDSSRAQQPNTSSKASKIAIVAMSGRFPDAANLGEFWDLLYQGRDVHRQIPEDRFNAELHYDATGRRKNTSKVMNGCFINEPGLFDARFFNMSPKEAEQSDPGQRMALETAYEALEMAGIVPDRTPSTQRDRVGVFYGMTSDDWREVNSGQNVDTYFIPGKLSARSSI